MAFDSEWYKYYAGKRVLITGHTGFKGTWLSVWLRLLEAEVAGVALAPDQEPSMYAALGGDKLSHSFLCDIRDADRIFDIFADFKPEVVFHLAAQSLVGRGYSDPVGTVTTNVGGTVVVLEAIRRVPTVRAVVNVTSDKCYENKEWAWPYRESDPLGGADPYSASKAAVEILAAAYRRSFFGPERGAAMATARAGNVIGGGDWAADRLIPDVVRALAGGSKIVLRQPSAVRPWQHVLEPLHGYLRLGCVLATMGSRFAESWNFGPVDAGVVSVGELAREVVAAWGNDNTNEPIVDAAVAPYAESRVLRLDVSKARQELNWHPLLTIGEAVQLTVDWYRDYYAGRRNLHEKTVSQITDFMQRMA